MSRDRPLLLAARGLRAFAFGFSAVLVALNLERAGLSPGLIGLTVGVGLAAASLTGLGSAALALRIGRRRTLAAAGLLMAMTGLDLALATQPLLLVLSGATGMLGAASVDYGPFASVEQAVVAETAAPARRNRAFARYSLTGGLFNAAGGLSAAGVPSLRAYFLLYAAIGLVTATLPLLMSSRVEGEPAEVAFGNVRSLAGLAALFALDSLGGGFVANAVIAYWLHARFGAGPGLLGPIFAGVAILQSLSYEVSGRLADRVGLINTMVFTHLPSNMLLLLVPFSPNLTVAVALLLARFALSQMDVPARQAYVVSIVSPSERAGAVAVTGAVRGVAMSLGPTLAGVAIGLASFGVPFFAGGGLKAVYDLALYAGYRSRPATHET
ncbi:MAG TPA: MFS transporter [Candidatus Dormibacteraeota bacterium]|jgi:MFS family permease|nr:MFS transporter [Candidatus Dormibacteraeota bacterium]HEX2682160.1 MFS transporter [Candidatus Dormibacteraeota bacterium]